MRLLFVLTQQVEICELGRGKGEEMGHRAHMYLALG
jgi:hypothetical protein